MKFSMCNKIYVVYDFITLNTYRPFYLHILDYLVYFYFDIC